MKVEWLVTTALLLQLLPLGAVAADKNKELHLQHHFTTTLPRVVHDGSDYYSVNEASSKPRVEQCPSFSSLFVLSRLRLAMDGPPLIEQWARFPKWSQHTFFILSLLILLTFFFLFVVLLITMEQLHWPNVDQTETKIVTLLLFVTIF